MDSSLSAEEAVALFGPAASSLASLLECGLQCIRKGHFAETMVLFALLHDQLSPQQAHLIAAINALVQSYTSYSSAQQALQEASKRFVEADTELQANLDLLEKLLPNLLEDGNVASFSVPQWLKNLLDHQGSSPSQSLPNSSRACQVLPSLQSPPEDRSTLPSLYFTCFSRFEVKRLDQPVTLCHNRNGQAILRYLVAQPGHRAAVDRLMGVLWPEDGLEVARRKLQVAVSALRRSLNNGYADDPGGGYVLFKDCVYRINPEVSLRSDVDEFLELYQAGRQTSENEAAALYERACHLYSGPFLVEDMYADWSFARREQLSQMYQKMCETLAEYYLKTERYEDVVKWASAILKENSCDEAAHRQLMRAYDAQGRRTEALRQYHRCEHTLLEELGVAPMPETVRLCQTILICQNDLEEAERK